MVDWYSVVFYRKEEVCGRRIDYVHDSNSMLWWGFDGFNFKAVAKVQ
jgi:hypothetical protein